MKDFTHRFAAHLNNFNAAIKPIEETLIEYYTSALGPEMAMFSKRSVQSTLATAYEEAKKIEAELESIEKYLVELETKTFSSKKPLLLTKPKDE